MVLSDLKSWKELSEEPKDWKKGDIAATEPIPEDLGCGATMNNSRVQGATPFWRETPGPFQEICFFQSSHRPHSFVVTLGST